MANPYDENDLGAQIQKYCGSLNLAQDHRQQIEQGVRYLSNGHPEWIQLAIQLACELLQNHREWSDQDFDFEQLIWRRHSQSSIHSIDARIRATCQSTEEKMLLTLIAIESGLIAPNSQRTPQSNNPGNVGERPSKRLITLDVLAVSHYGQEWLSAEFNILRTIKALDSLEDNGVITYDSDLGWRIAPLVAVYYWHKGWDVTDSLELGQYFPEW